MRDPFVIDGPTCISAYMLWRVFQINGQEEALACFCGE